MVKQRVSDYAHENGQRENVNIIPLDTLRQQAGSLCILPSLPDSFVNRTEVSQKLKHLLLETRNSQGKDRTIALIHGQEGAGKSTLAAALIRDSEVLAHFPDGLLWANLGQEPDLLLYLNNSIQALGDCDFKGIALEAASIHFKMLLECKSVLIILDDVCNSKDIEFFRVTNSNSRILAITKEVTIKDAVSCQLDVMSWQEAKEMIALLINKQPTKEEEKKLQHLTKTLEYLPLAIKLAIVEINKGTSIAKFLEDLQTEIARLKTIDELTTDRISKGNNWSLLASLNLNLRRLSSQQLQSFAWLGILAEGAIITEKMAATLWKCDRPSAKKTLEYFYTQGLLVYQENTKENLSYRLHPTISDKARKLLSAPTNTTFEGNLPGLGLTLLEAHRELLLRYRATTKNNLWHTLEDDGYIHERLTWHLEKADWIEEVHQLLQEETEEGENGWYRACESLEKSANYVKDIVRAWQLAEEAYIKSPSVAIGWQCRYALIISSISNWTEKIPAELMAEMVENQVCTPDQGLVYAQQAAEPSDRVTVLNQLAPYLPKSFLPKVLEAAKSIPDMYYRALALSKLAPHLPESLLPEVLEAAKNIESEPDRAIAISELIPHLPESLLSQAIEATTSIKSESERARALSELAPHLPKSQIVKVLEAARNIEDNYYRVLILSELAPYLPEILPEALEAARNIQDKYYRASVLSDLAPHLPKSLLPEVLEAAKEIQDEYYLVSVLSDLAPHLPVVLLPEALEMAKNINSQSDRASVLGDLIPYLPKYLLLEVLEAAKSIESESDRVRVLKELISYLPASFLPQVLTTLREIQDNYYRAIILSNLASYMPETILEALESVKNIDSEGDRASALSQLAPHLPESLQLEVLNIAKSIESESERAKVLSELAPCLSESILPKALEAAKCIVGESDLVQVLSELAPYLSESLQLEVLNIAKSLDSESSRASVLSKLAPHLSESLLLEALEAAKSIYSERDRASVLSKLAPYLPESLLLEVLEAAKSIYSERDRASVLSHLVSYLPESLLPEVLEATKFIFLESYRASVMKEFTLQIKSSEINSIFLWQEMLHALAYLSRSYLLPNLCGLSSVIMTLGGSEALAETARAILDVEKWWQ